MFFSVNMLNNWAFAFNISVPMHIILRSFGSVQTMAVGWTMGKRYSRVQVGSVAALTVGVVVAAWADASRKVCYVMPLLHPITLIRYVGLRLTLLTLQGAKLDLSASSTGTTSTASTTSYSIGLALLFTAQLISAYMGVLTESTYNSYGRHWGEVLFYTHLLGFVFSLAFAPTILGQWRRLVAHESNMPGARARTRSMDAASKNAPPDPSTIAPPSSPLHDLFNNLTAVLPLPFPVPQLLTSLTSLPTSLTSLTPTSPLPLLALNALTQIACISGVNRLSAQTTAVTVTVVLNVRKLVSFLISCVVFGNPVSILMGLGAGLVFVSGAVYGWDSARGRGEDKKGGKEGIGEKNGALRAGNQSRHGEQADMKGMKGTGAASSVGGSARIRRMV